VAVEAGAEAPVPEPEVEPAIEVALAAGVPAGAGVEPELHAAAPSITASARSNPDRFISPWSPDIGRLSNVPGSAASCARIGRLG
jgi:hypothetical protein